MLPISPVKESVRQGTNKMSSIESNTHLPTNMWQIHETEAFILMSLIWRFEWESSQNEDITATNVAALKFGGTG